LLKETAASANLSGDTFGADHFSNVHFAIFLSTLDHPQVELKKRVTFITVYKSYNKK
jgi:hypothetical protein